MVGGKNSIRRHNYVTFFLILELSIYLSFLYIDISERMNYNISSYLKFAGIVICWLYAVFSPADRVNSRDSKNGKDSKDGTILKTALLFTVVSDLFLLIYDYYLIGVITFCIVQMLYMMRLCRWSKKERYLIHLIKKLLRNLLAILTVMVILYALEFSWNWIAIVSIIYFISFVFNVMDSVVISHKTKNRKQVVFTAGLILFLLCDINVGLFNMIDVTNVNHSWLLAVYHFSTIAMWMFYLPAQVLIVLSKYTKNN
jgi:hypothetical protein